MKKAFLALLSISAIALTGCNKKVEFKEFHEKAVEAAKVTAPEVEKMVIKGKIVEDGEELKADKITVSKDSKLTDFSIGDMAIIAIVTEFKGMPITVSNSDKITYYCGSGFKVKDNETGSCIEWDKYLNPTDIDVSEEGNVVDLDISYTYAG